MIQSDTFPRTSKVLDFLEQNPRPSQKTQIVVMTWVFPIYYMILAILYSSTALFCTKNILHTVYLRVF